jgi:hypothetical protein
MEDASDIIRRKRDGLLNMWPDANSKINKDYRAFPLPSGQTVGDVVRQERAGLLNTWRSAQESVKSYPGDEPAFAPGYAAGRAIGEFKRRMSSNGPVDFKNNFKNPAAGDEYARELGRAGNFAYYDIGDGILPRGLLDVGAAYYALKGVWNGDKKLEDLTLPRLIDKSAYSVRDKALSLPDLPFPEEP